MYIYIIFFFLLLLTGFISALRKNKRWVMFVLLLSALFFCFGYMTGSDWRAYEAYYDYLDSPDFFEIALLEPGYKLYSWLFEYIGFSFWLYFILTKLTLFYIIIYFVRKIASEYLFVFSITFFLFYFGLFLFIDNPMRNLIAVGISLFSYKYLMSRKIGKYVMVVLLAACFHFSAILLLFVYFLYPIRVKNTIIVLSYIVFNLIFIIAFENILINILEFFAFIPKVEDKMISYFINGDELAGNTLFSVGFLFQLAIFALLLLKRKSIESTNYGKLIFLGSMVYLFLYRIGLTVEILYRFQLYFSILYSIGICLLLYTMRGYKQKIFYFSFIASFLFVVLIQTITSSEKYIPYTNYIQYMFGDNLSFEERSQYNFIHSPYVKKRQE